MLSYGFWNNKGGTGKTSLCFQSICFYAHQHPEERILVIDVCPQANLSELLLGGLANGGSDRLLARQGAVPRATIGGYFQQRLPSPYQPPAIEPLDYITTPCEYNDEIPENVDLICGDPLLELQANAISTLANNNIPGTDSWIAIIDWIKDLLQPLSGKYDVAFIDCNPSFSIYTQIALSTVDRMVLPVMADDSSRRAIQNAFSLVYGLKLPSDIYATYAFATRLRNANRTLPKVHMIVKNRLTQYMGKASAYAAVLRSIDRDIEKLMDSNPEIFTFEALNDGIVDVRDFQTTGVVAFAKGTPLYSLKTGKRDVMGQRVTVHEDYKANCVEHMNDLVGQL
ncbi:ParA family protein [Mycolicibacterium confluentis]|uniref:ATPase n=1 Tax=Mycolicibacterium confluentis TaxID=28047 RepID=A0A7I7XXK0_9MYCO|nr:ParA family protein [Mycolicibacterium confluentis]MCV7318400.1 ParA family protein [Mycolicibacterium confluentis]ORV20233.1 ATPase [Mycolicibacterium confluentis]BBZ34060.1 ATPase [Mycolicibacterium confluentis]